jgi:UDP-glucose 4-epimerase
VLVADARLAASLLGWRPTLSDLDTIIQTAVDWYCRQATPQPAGVPAATG